MGSMEIVKVRVLRDVYVSGSDRKSGEILEIPVPDARNHRRERNVQWLGEPRLVQGWPDNIVDVDDSTSAPAPRQVPAEDNGDDDEPERDATAPPEPVADENQPKEKPKKKVSVD